MANINAGAVVWNLDIDDSKFKSKLKSASSAMQDGADKTEKATNKSWLKMGAVMGAVAGAAQAAFSKAMDVISNSVQGAIKRVDILNNFPKIMSNMNISADESKKTINELSKSLQGLPTPLDTAALAVQRLTTSTGDVKKAKDVFLALNNAILAGGAPMDLQSSAMEQFSQAFAKGKPDMIEWRSLMSAMPAQLKQLAEHLKMPNVDALGEALRNGDISMQQFSDALIELNKNGTGQFQSFEKQAKNSTGGVQTGIANMQTAISRGMANVLQAVGQENISNIIANIGKAFENATKAIIPLIEFIGRNKDIFATLAVGIAGATGAFVAYRAIVAVTSALSAAYAGVTTYLTLVQSLQAQGMGVLRAAWFALNTVMKANPIGIIITLIAGLVAGLVWFFTKTETGRKVFAKFTEILKKGFEAIKKAGGAVVDFFKNNWKIIAAVALAPLLPMIGIIVLLVKNFHYIKDAAITVWNVIKTVFTAIWNFISPILNFIKNLFIIVFGGIAILVIMYVKMWYTVITTVLRAIWGFIQPILMGIWNFFKAVWNGIYMAVKTYLTLMFDFYKTIFTAIYNVITGIVRSIINFFAPAVQWLYGRGRDIIQGLINGIRNLADGVWQAIKFVADKIGNFFSGAWNWLYGVGKAIIEGLIRGVRDMSGQITRAVSDTANSIKDKFKNLLGIHSPSRIFAGFGGDIAQGLIKGIDKSKSMVNSAVAGLSEVATSNIGVEVGSVPQVSDMGTKEGSNSNVQITLNMSGIMARSRTDLRDIGHDMIQAVNEGLRAKGVAEIGGGAI